MRGSKIATLDAPTRSQVISLRKGGMYPAQICERLGLTLKSELNAVSEICREPGMRRYQKGIESAAEGKTRNGRKNGAP